MLKYTYFELNMNDKVVTHTFIEHLSYKVNNIMEIYRLPEAKICYFFIRKFHKNMQTYSKK